MNDPRSERISQLRSSLAEDPLSEAFLELAKLLGEDSSTRAEARELCFAGLTKNPSQLLARLTLAQLFYLDGQHEFAIRELVELRRRAKIPAIDKLLRAFGAYAEPYLQGVELGSVLQGAIVEHSGAVGSESEQQTPTAVEADEEDILAEIDLDAEFLELGEELKK